MLFGNNQDGTIEIFMPIFVRSFFKNLSSLALGTIIARFVNFIATVYIARALGASQFGVFSFSLTIFIAYSMIANLGLENLIVRQVARSSPQINQFLGDAIIVRLLAIPLGILISILLWFNNPTALGIIVFLFGYGLMNATILFVSAIFRGLERMEIQTLLVSAQAILTTGFVLIALFFDENAFWVAAAYCFASSIVAISSWFLLKKFAIQPRFRWQPSSWKMLILQNLPFTISLIGLLIFDRHAVIFIAYFADEAAVGWFNAVYFIILAIVNVPLIIINTFYPQLSRASLIEETNQLPILFSLILKMVNMISLPIAISLYVYSDFIVELFYGFEYAPASKILQLLAISIPFLFMVIVLNSMLQTMDAQKLSAWAFCVGLILILPLTGILTWWGGYLSATMGYTISAMILAAIFIGAMHKQMSFVEKRKTFAFPLIAGSSMLVIFSAFRTPTPPFFAILLALAAYFAALIFTGVLSKDLWYTFKYAVQ